MERSALLRDGHVDRLDAEFHASEIVDTETKFRDGGAALLGSLVKIVEDRVEDPARSGDPDEFFPYLEISDVDTRDGFALAGSVPRREAPSRARLSLPDGVVVLSSVRPNRNAVALIAGDLSGSVGSTGFVVLKGEKIAPEVLLLALKSRVVVDQLVRRARASMYPALHPPDVLDVWVPSLTEKAAKRAVRAVRTATKARAAYVARQTALQDAVAKFLDAADPAAFIADLGMHEPMVVSTATLAKTKRADAEFHTPAFLRLHARLTSMGKVRTLGNLVLEADTGKTPSGSAYVESGGTPLLKVASLSNSGIIWPALGHAGAEYQLKAGADVVDGDVVFTSSAHAPLHICLKVDVVRGVPEEDAAHLTFVGELMRLRLKPKSEVSPEYLGAFLRHSIGREQVRRCIRGITSHVYPPDVLANVIVPIPPAALARRIKEAAAEAGAARQEYRRVMTTAIASLEEEWA